MKLFLDFFTSPLVQSLLPGYLWITSLFLGTIAALKPISGSWLGLAYRWRDVGTVALVLWVGLPLGYFGLCLFLTLA